MRQTHLVGHFFGFFMNFKAREMPAFQREWSSKLLLTTASPASLPRFRFPALAIWSAMYARKAMRADLMSSSSMWHLPISGAHECKHHTTPHHTTPHRTTPHHTTPHHTTPHRTAPHHTRPHHTTPHHTTPHRTTPHHTTPHHTTPHRTAPH